MSRERQFRGADFATPARREPDGPTRSPDQAAEAHARHLREEVEIIGRHLDEAIEHTLSAPEWNDRKSKLLERVGRLEKRLRAKAPNSDSKPEKAMNDLRQAHDQLAAIKTKLRAERARRAVAPVVGEVAL